MAEAIDMGGDYIRNDFESLRYSFITAYKAWEGSPPTSSFERNYEREKAWLTYIEIRDLWISAPAPFFTGSYTRQ